MCQKWQTCCDEDGERDLFPAKIRNVDCKLQHMYPEGIRNVGRPNKRHGTDDAAWSWNEEGEEDVGLDSG